MLAAKYVVHNNRSTCNAADLSTGRIREISRIRGINYVVRVGRACVRVTLEIPYIA